MFISIGKAIDTWAPTSRTLCHAKSDIPVMWMNRLSGPIRCRDRATLADDELLEGGPDAERREDVRRDLEAEAASDFPRRLGAGVTQVHLAAHDHGDELIGRREPLLLDARRVLRILIVRIGAENVGTGTLEYPKAARRPVSNSAWIAASEFCGEWWICDTSCTVVTPSSSWLRPAKSSLMYTSCGEIPART
jgi:hypothetical protein